MKLVEKHIFKRANTAEYSERLVNEIIEEIEKGKITATHFEGNMYILHSAGREKRTNFYFGPGKYNVDLVEIKGLAIFVNLINGEAHGLSITDEYKIEMLLDPKLYPSNEEIYNMAIGIYGGSKQSLKTLEEASEFSQALAKDLIDGNNRDNVVLELADLENTLAQVKEIYKISNGELSAAKTYKMRRLYNEMEKIPETMDKFAECIKKPEEV